MVLNPKTNQYLPLDVSGYKAKQGQSEAELKQIHDRTTDLVFTEVKFVGNHFSASQAAEIYLDMVEHPEHGKKALSAISPTDITKKEEANKKREEWIKLYSGAQICYTNARRSYAQGQMRNAAFLFMANPVGGLKEGQLPDEKLIEGINNRTIDSLDENDKAIVVWWMDCMLTKADGVSQSWPDIDRHYKTISKCKKLNQYTGEEICQMTPSTEAFTVTVFENCREKWMAWYEWEKNSDNAGFALDLRQQKPSEEQLAAMGKTKGGKPKKIVSIEENPRFKTKFSNPACGQKMFEGWSTEGITRYIELKNKNEQARNSKLLRKMEKDFLEILRNHHGLSGNSPGEEDPTNKRAKLGAPVDPPPTFEGLFKPAEGCVYEESDDEE